MAAFWRVREPSFWKLRPENLFRFAIQFLRLAAQSRYRRLGRALRRGGKWIFPRQHHTQPFRRRGVKLGCDL